MSKFLLLFISFTYILQNVDSLVKVVKMTRCELEVIYWRSFYDNENEKGEDVYNTCTPRPNATNIRESFDLKSKDILSLVDMFQQQLDQVKKNKNKQLDQEKKNKKKQLDPEKKNKRKQLDQEKKNKKKQLDQEKKNKKKQLDQEKHQELDDGSTQSHIIDILLTKITRHSEKNTRCELVALVLDVLCEDSKLYYIPQMALIIECALPLIYGGMRTVLELIVVPYGNGNYFILKPNNMKRLQVYTEVTIVGYMKYEKTWSELYYVDESIHTPEEFTNAMRLPPKNIYVSTDPSVETARNILKQKGYNLSSSKMDWFKKWISSVGSAVKSENQIS